MPTFNLDASTIQTLITGASRASVVHCATACLDTHERAHRRDADQATAPLEAAETWHGTAADYRARKRPPERPS
jgi:alkylhydroperoxidase family enzyme